jgi:nucleotide-binding universal stress UspA family protein
VSFAKLLRALSRAGDAGVVDRSGGRPRWQWVLAIRLRRRGHPLRRSLTAGGRGRRWLTHDNYRRALHSARCASAGSLRTGRRYGGRGRPRRRHAGSRSVRAGRWLRAPWGPAPTTADPEQLPRLLQPELMRAAARHRSCAVRRVGSLDSVSSVKPQLKSQRNARSRAASSSAHDGVHGVDARPVGRDEGRGEPNRRVGAMATRLLIAYDGSTAAEAAVVTAGRLFAAARGCLLTVIEPTPGPARVQAFAFTLDPGIIQRGLERLAQKVMDDGREIAARGLQTAETAGLTMEARVIPREGSESQTILLEADATDAEVIVCGSRGRGAVARSLLGSTSTSVLHHATRPVLVVPADPGAIEGHALIAYDGSTGARAAIAVAGRVLRGRRATIVNVWNSPMRHTLSGRVLAGAPVGELRAFSADYEPLFADEAASVIEEGLAAAREAGLDASGEALESGSGAWRALAEAATDRHATVIVAGSRGRGGLGIHDPRLGLVGPRPQCRDAGAHRPTGELSSQDGAGGHPEPARRLACLRTVACADGARTRARHRRPLPRSCPRAGPRTPRARSSRA